LQLSINMPAFFGITATSNTSTAYNIPAKIKSFSLVNKTGGAITVSAGCVFGSGVTYWVFNEPLNAGESYVWPGDEILLLAEYSIFVSASGSCDYYFTLE